MRLPPRRTPLQDHQHRRGRIFPGALPQWDWITVPPLLLTLVLVLILVPSRRPLYTQTKTMKSPTGKWEEAFALVHDQGNTRAGTVQDRAAMTLVAQTVRRAESCR